MNPQRSPATAFSLLGLCAGCALVASVASADAVRARPPPLPSAGELASLLDAHDVPGAAMAGLTACEVDAGTVVAGSADLGAGTPVTPDTAFEAASLSKPVFAYLVMSLVEEGTIALDAPIAEHFGYPRIPDKAAYARLTPRMVLVHRTGLPNWVDERTDFHERTAPVPFLFEPGTAYGYSGEGFQLLQAFVEARTGRTLQTLFEERLGTTMPRSSFARPLPEGALPSRGYARASDPASGRDMDNLGERGLAASSLVTTAGDYARFLSRVCKREGLAAETYAAMLAPQSPVPEGELPFPASWSLGWMIMELPDDVVIGHGGNNDEYRAFAGFTARDGHGLVLLTNGANGQRLIDEVTAPPPSADPTSASPASGK